MVALKGHALVAEGAPHTDRGHRISIGRYAGIGGPGRAKCSCGELSPDLASAYQRKAWHKAHKEALIHEGEGREIDRVFVLENALREALGELEEAVSFIRDETGHTPTVQHMRQRIHDLRKVLS